MGGFWCAHLSDEGEGQAWQVSAYDRGNLHIEVRYNYEDFDTGSLFAGWTFTFGWEENYLKVTPTAAQASIPGEKWTWVRWWDSAAPARAACR